MQSVGSGVMGWVLEQGKCSQNLGQQAVVHRAARRTFESKCCRRSSAQLLRTPPPDTHRAQSELVCAANAQDHDVDGPRSTFDAQYHHHQDYLGRREQGAEAARAALDTTSVGTRTGCKCNTSSSCNEVYSVMERM